jgi:hypothetical protein
MDWHLLLSLLIVFAQLAPYVAIGHLPVAPMYVPLASCFFSSDSVSLVPSSAA